MLVPLFQKAEASETVSPVVRSLAASALIKEVGLSYKQLYQGSSFIAKKIASLRGIEPLDWRSYLSQPTRGLGFSEVL
ncbi:hypothetical protein LEP3755_00110 [Leptolyngbya sp. NIES-3755]|nr:hypothetical protein LEP3755_00110 [Leptolyngbya sp. NIES-3755]